MTGYGTALAASIAGLSVRQVDYLDRRGIVRPDLRAAGGYGSRRVYSFLNLVELRTLKRLRDDGISLQKVRRCLEHMREHLPTSSRPLGSQVLVSDGRTVYLGESARKWSDLLRGGQMVFSVSVGVIWDEIEKRTSGPEAELRTVKVAGRPYRVVVTADPEDGGFVADCPLLLGCMSQGETVREALRNVREAISDWLAVRRAKRKRAGGRRAV